VRAERGLKQLGGSIDDRLGAVGLAQRAARKAIVAMALGVRRQL
jgi:hypothetical protein